MRRRLRIAFCFLCYWTGLIEVFYFFRRRRLLILCYHNVIPDEMFDGALHLGVSHRISEFNRHLDLISSRFRTTPTFSNAAPGSCIVTFDDGYRNNLLAADCLAQRGMCGVFFVPVEPLANGKTLAIDLVQQWFSYVPPGTYLMGPQKIIIHDERRLQAYVSFYDWMRAHAAIWQDVSTMLDRLYRFSELRLSERMTELRFTPLSLADLDKLKEAGHFIGCHSWNHRPLATLTDETIDEDFTACEGTRSYFNTAVYSYPFGGNDEIDQRSVEACKRFHYVAAVTNTVRPAVGAGQFSLPRESLPQETNRYLLEGKLSGLDAALKFLLCR